MWHEMQGSMGDGDAQSGLGPDDSGERAPSPVHLPAILYTARNSALLTASAECAPVKDRSLQDDRHLSVSACALTLAGPCAGVLVPLCKLQCACRLCGGAAALSTAHAAMCTNGHDET